MHLPDSIISTSFGEPLLDNTWSTMDWYSPLWDTELLSTEAFNNINDDLRFESFIGDIDPMGFPDVFSASAALAVDLNVPELLPLSTTPPEDETVSNMQSPQNMDMLDSPSSASTPPSVTEQTYSPPTPPTRRNSRTSHNTNSQSRQKALHNAVERRYRDNMNAKFLALAEKMPKIYGEDSAVVMGRKPPKRKAGELYQSKTDVLDNALAYIDQLHREKKALAAQVASLKKGLQAKRIELKRCNKLGLNA